MKMEDCDVELPDIFRQAALGKGSFQFLLRNKSNGNIMAMLEPVNVAQYFGDWRFALPTSDSRRFLRTCLFQHLPLTDPSFL